MKQTRLALVTGSAGGLGAHLATLLSSQGYRVLLHSRSQFKATQKLAKQIGSPLIFQGDLSSEKTTKAIAAQIQEKWGSLDLLINNAGVYHEKGLSELTESEWFEGFNSTATAAFFTTRSLLPLIRKSKTGRVINIGDSSCDRPTARDLSLSYHIGKTGVLMLTKSFAQSEARYGVTCNMVSPGWLENSVGKLSERQIPAGRKGRYQDIWNAVEFLLKPESQYLTGSNLVVSGGWNLR